MDNSLIAETSVSIHASPSRVWQTITTPSLIKKYLMGTDVHTDWKDGSPITYTGEYNGKKYADKGRIEKIVPEKVLQTTYWSSMGGKPDIPENYKLVTYSISRDGDETVVTLLQDNNSDETERDHSQENWRKVLGKLKEVAESSSN